MSVRPHPQLGVAQLAPAVYRPLRLHRAHITKEMSTVKASVTVNAPKGDSSAQSSQPSLPEQCSRLAPMADWRAGVGSKGVR